jgi:hypothetical protein
MFRPQVTRMKNGWHDEQETINQKIQEAKAKWIEAPHGNTTQTEIKKRFLHNSTITTKSKSTWLSKPKVNMILTTWKWNKLIEELQSMTSSKSTKKWQDVQKLMEVN